MDKREVINILNSIGMLLEIKGESFFKSKAYYDAARKIELLEDELETVVKEGRLKELKGFGRALTEKITELINTGSMDYYDRLKSSIPEGLIEMTRIPGLGPKKVRAIYENLGIDTIDGLKQACLEGKISKLPGFGAKTQEKILEGIENMGKYKDSFLFPEAMGYALALISYLKESGYVIRCSEGGSLRRRKETVKDIDILASSSDSGKVMALFTAHPLVDKVVSSGGTKSSVVLKGGINADLRVVSDVEYPYALHHFTGSREHNTAMRHTAKQQGIKMNEYGLFKEDKLIECKTEEDIFNVFKMQYIPPELRENAGELEAAMRGEIPQLVQGSDIKGVLHVHSNYSDGFNSIEEMAEACISRGYTYLGISDHSMSAYYAGGLKPSDLKRQHDEIDRLREKYKDFYILKGIELEILPDGSVDYDDEVLELFDFTIASVHSSFNMSEEKMTERVIKAMKSGFVDILGHPSGRLLLAREPYRINMNEIIKTAANYGIIIEINANPHRLDLDWRFCKAAKEEGVRFAICPDAHDISGIDDIRFGVNIARKGWLAAGDIINTLDAERISSVFKNRKLKNG
jgi:DNA polymerase (family 10)